MAHDALHIQEKRVQNWAPRERVIALMVSTPSEKRDRLARLLSLFVEELWLPQFGHSPQTD